MTLNIRDLARLAEFELDTSSFGRVRIGNLKVSDVSAAETARVQQDVQPENVVRGLFSRLARPLESAEDNRAPDDELAVHFDGTKLTPEEVEQFAQQLVKHNAYFAKDADGDEISKEVNESSAAFLLRLIQQYHVTQRERWEKLMRPVTSPLFGDATRAAWSESVLASDRLGATIDALRAKDEFRPRTEVPSLPRVEHPMRGTNERLDTLVERLEDYRPALINTAAAIVALERTVREMQADFTTNSAETDRRTFRAEVVAIAGLVFAAVGFMTSTFFSIKQLNDDSVVTELRAIRKEQEIDQKNLAAALEKSARAETALHSEKNGQQSNIPAPSQDVKARPQEKAAHASLRPSPTNKQN